MRMGYTQCGGSQSEFPGALGGKGKGEKYYFPKTLCMGFMRSKLFS